MKSCGIIFNDLIFGRHWFQISLIRPKLHEPGIWYRRWDTIWKETFKYNPMDTFCQNKSFGKWSEKFHQVRQCLHFRICGVTFRIHIVRACMSYYKKIILLSQLGAPLHVSTCFSYAANTCSQPPRPLQPLLCDKRNFGGSHFAGLDVRREDVAFYSDGRLQRRVSTASQCEQNH